jgi:hypothetical protein
MKITVRRSGGFAGPLLRKTFEFSPETLPAAAARKLQTLLEAGPLRALHNQRFHAFGGADLLKYEVLVETAEGSTRFFFDETAVPAEFAPVWKFLSERMD